MDMKMLLSSLKNFVEEFTNTFQVSLNNEKVTQYVLASLLRGFNIAWSPFYKLKIHANNGLTFCWSTQLDGQLALKSDAHNSLLKSGRKNADLESE